MTEPARIINRPDNHYRPSDGSHEVLQCETCNSDIGRVDNAETKPHTLRECVVNLLVRVNELDSNLDQLWDRVN
jgi:hypothetical protein